ncbi:hypothetical protein [Actinomadura alba]|uniref:hypothetical protein n=1 Tax=Actinomadura alba TaxID=406431 RepID=UPI001C9D580F|nr:hypothetical protein [Actinomadura alba]
MSPTYEHLAFAVSGDDEVLAPLGAVPRPLALVEDDASAGLCLTPIGMLPPATATTWSARVNPSWSARRPYCCMCHRPQGVIAAAADGLT